MTAGNAESESDLSGYFDPGDFGRKILLLSVNRSAWALFDNEDEEVQPEVGDNPVIAPRTRVTMMTSDLSGVELGDRVEVNGTEFEITTRLDSGDGLTVLRLVEV
jgi:hypothetical protein